MAYIQMKQQGRLVPMTFRVSKEHADRYLRSREIAAKHHHVINLRGELERIIDAVFAEAQAMDRKAANADAPKVAATDR